MKVSTGKPSGAINISLQQLPAAQTRAEVLSRQLIELVGDTVETHRDDLLIHDANAIAKMQVPEFIHVAYCSGSHIYELPRRIDDNSVIPYLFGSKRPSEIYMDRLDLLATYFDRPEYFGYRHRFSYSDGKKVRAVTKCEAVRVYKSALDSVLRELARKGVSA